MYLALGALSALMGLSLMALVNSRNIVRAGLGLFGVLVSVAGLFVLAASDFLAVAQLIVYVGGILLLLLFGVMLTNRHTGEAPKTEVYNRWPAALICLGLFGVFVAAFGEIALWRQPLQQPLQGSTAKLLGQGLLTHYLPVFELLSVFLLIALVAAAFLARRIVGRDAEG